MAKQQNITFYTDKQLAEEITKIRGQVDMMENLLQMQEDSNASAQRFFSAAAHISVADPVSVKFQSRLPLKRRLIRKGYHIVKKMMEIIHLAEPFKRTQIYQKLSEQGRIYVMATGCEQNKTGGK